MTDTIWESQSQSLTGAATGGRVIKGRYKLTHEFLYFETGTLRTDAQQVPIVSVLDVDVKQSMTQKARHVGDVIVHIERPGGNVELVTMASIPDPKDAQRIINDTARHAWHALHARANTMNYTQSVPSYLAAHADSTAGAPAEDHMAKLRQLGELRDAGILTEPEFESKKADILSRM